MATIENSNTFQNVIDGTAATALTAATAATASDAPGAVAQPRPVTPVYTRRVTAEQMAEESRIATAQGLRDIAAALAAKGITNRHDDVHSDSEDDSIDSRPKRRRRRGSYGGGGGSGGGGSSSSRNQDEKASHLLKVELASVMVEKNDLNAEIAKLQLQLQPYSNVNNELALIKSAIDRLNKDTSDMTINQLEKRQGLFREEFTEHKALLTIAVSKINLADVKACVQRVLNAEVKRSGIEDKKLTVTIWYRKCTETTTKLIISSALVLLLSYFFYWYFQSWFKVR